VNILKPTVPRIPTFAILAALIFSAAAPASANMFRTFGFGPRPVAMGGAFTAVADDFTASYYNPAGILAVKKTRVGVGWQFIKQNYEVNGDAVHGNFTDGAYMGFSMPVPFKDWLTDRIGVGYGFYQPILYVIDLTVPEERAPQFVLTESAPEVQIIHLALAVDAIPGTLIGAGATFLSDLGGTLDMHTGIRGIEGMDDIVTMVDQEAQPIISPTAGILFRPGTFFPRLDRLTVGLTWRDEFSLDLAFPVIIALGIVPLNLDLTSEFIYTPMQFVLGLAYRVTDRLLLSFDLSYNDWSEYRPPTLEERISFDIPLFEVDFNPGLNEDPRTEDTFTPRLGAEYRLLTEEALGLTVRGGYYWDPTPLSEQRSNSNFLDGDRHVFSFGAGLAIKRFLGFDLSKRPVSIEMAFQYQLLSEMRHRKAGHVKQSNPGYPEITGSGDLYFFSIGISLGMDGAGPEERAGKGAPEHGEGE